MVGTGRSEAEEESHSCTRVLKTRKNRMRFCRCGGREQPRLDLSWIWGKVGAANIQSSSDSLSTSRRN